VTKAADRRGQQAIKSACKPCGELALHFSWGDAFPTVELVDCRKEFDLLSDFLQGNVIGQLANCGQKNSR
jgi:hypothetical protein